MTSRPYARALDWLRHDFLRTRLGPDQNVLGRGVVGRDLVQLAAQEGRGPSEAAIRLLEGREKVEKEDMIKGYEFAKGRYVQFTPDELKALEEKGTGSINITEFVDADTVDRMD